MMSFVKTEKILSTYRDKLKICDKIKENETLKGISKLRKDFPTAVSNYKKGEKVLSQWGHLLEVSKNWEV